MPAATALLIGFGMFLVLFALATIGYVIYDKGRIAVEYETASGEVDVVLKRPGPEGIELDEGNHPAQKIIPRSEFTQIWHGSWKPWTYPMVRVDAETGNVLARRDKVAVHVREDEDVDREEIPPELVQVAWPHVYWTWLDSDVVKQALEAHKDPWQRMAGALVIGMVLISFAFLAMVWITAGGS